MGQVQSKFVYFFFVRLYLKTQQLVKKLQRSNTYLTNALNYKLLGTMGEKAYSAILLPCKMYCHSHRLESVDLHCLLPI